MDITATAVDAAQDAAFGLGADVDGPEVEQIVKAAAPFIAAQALRDLERSLCVMDEHSDPNLEDVVEIIWRRVNELEKQ